MAKDKEKNWMGSLGQLCSGIGVLLTGVAAITAGGQFFDTKKLEGAKIENELKENFVKNQTPENVINSTPANPAELDFGTVYLPMDKKEAVQRVIDDTSLTRDDKQAIIQQELKVKK